jgi:hypothetical protein
MQGLAREVHGLDPCGVSGQGHEAVKLPLELQRGVEVPLSRLGLFDIALDELDGAAVGVLQLLLEGEGLAAIAPVAHDRQRTFLKKESRDGGAQASRAPGHEDDLARERLAHEVEPVFPLAFHVLGVEEARGHGQPAKRARSPVLSRPSRDATTRCAAVSLSAG